MTARRLAVLATETLGCVRTMFGRTPPAPYQHSAPGTSGRHCSGFQAWLPHPSQQQPPVRALSVLASSKARAADRSGEAPDASARRAGPRPSSDLQTVPGIGRVNEQRLVRKGLTSVELLTEVFIERKKRNQEEMIAYLQTDIGIRRQHGQNIVRHLADLQKGDEAAAALANPNRRITLCVEGNISAGKSSFLQRILKGSLELRDVVEVVPEPVEKWQAVRGAPGGPGPAHNMLDAFYKEPQRYAYTFQNYVFLTRVMQEEGSCRGDRPLRLLERSVFSDRMVFVRAVHEARWMDDMELAVYDSWFDPMVAQLPGVVPDGFVYLHASPETCARRMAGRGRAEEGGVSLEYLANLHGKHEEWLRAGALTAGGVAAWADRPLSQQMLVPAVEAPLSLRGEQFRLHAPEPSLAMLNPDDEPHSCRGKIYYLNKATQPELQRHINGLPALFLDCNDDIDLEHDTCAKARFAQQISEFSDFVRRLQARRNLILPPRPRLQHPGEHMSMELLQGLRQQLAPC